MILADFRCEEHGVFEAIADSGADATSCPECGASSPWSPSPVRGRVKLGEVSQGKFEPPPSPGALDTRALADGMPYTEWKAKREKQHKERYRRSVKEKTG